MRIINKEKFDSLTSYTTKNEPVADEVGIHKLSTMIAHKTKFRVADVEEVMKEAAFALYALLLERKTVNLGGIKLKTKWFPYEEPRYVRLGNGYWTFGYYFPRIEMVKDGRLLYSGRDGEFNPDFIEGILPYLPDDVKNEEDIIKFSLDIMEATCQEGKDVIIDEEGYIIQTDPKKKRKYFDETFHPTYLEMVHYHMARKKAIGEYYKKKNDGEDVGDLNDYVYSQLRERGFKVGADRGGTKDELSTEG